MLLIMSHIKNIRVTTVNKNMTSPSSNAVEADLSFSLNFFGISEQTETVRSVVYFGHEIGSYRTSVLSILSRLTILVLNNVIPICSVKSDESTYFDITTYANIYSTEQVAKLSNHKLIFSTTEIKQFKFNVNSTIFSQ